jgi:hypothetical protein
MAILRAEHRTDGMAAKGDQLGQQMAAGSLERAGVGESTVAGVDELF